MKKNNQQSSYPLRKYYAIMLVAFSLFLGVMIYYSMQFKNKRELAKQQVNLNEETVDVEGNASQVTTETTEATTTATQASSTQTTPTTTQASLHYDGKTKLAWPVFGNIILPYSVDTTVYYESLDQYRVNQGVVIESKVGTKVKALKQAKVKKIGKSAEFGQTILLDLGDDYTALYGQLEKINVKEGDTVNQGQVIAQVAKPTDYYTLEGTNLYLELTKDKKSINPVEYLK